MMLNKLPTDVRQYIQEKFTQSEIEEVGERWQIIYKEIGTRFLRAVVYLAEGQVDAIDTYLKFLEKNNKDILDWAENDEKNRKVRDFSKTFQENGLL